MKAERSDDKRLEFAFSRLAGELELVHTFRLAGRYSEAKYTAAAVQRHLLDVLAQSKSQARPDGLAESIQQYVREIDELPDTINVTDRSAEIVARRETQPGPESYPVGTRVRVAPLDILRAFKTSWNLHHPLEEEQLKYADTWGCVKAVGYYHGEDVLYSLDSTGDFVWHEQCLVAAKA